MFARSLIGFLLLIVACTSARMEDREPDRLFFQGQYKQAAEKLQKSLQSRGEDHRDALLYLLDLGLALHMAGEYAESTKVFLKADKRAEIFDYTSLAEEATTLLASDNSKPYKAEDFEYVMISTYLALNFALENKPEDALVEARRVNRKLLRMVNEGKRRYKQDAFARYFSGILFESEGEFDDAYLDYKSTRELNPEFIGVGEDLYRMAIALKRNDEAEKWKGQYSISDDRASLLRKVARTDSWGEVVILYQNGISPIKRPHRNFHSVPEFKPRHNPVTAADVWVDGEKKATTYKLKDIEATAIENLEEKWGGMIAKKVAGVVVKEVAGEAVGSATKSRELGFLVKLILHASDQADIRSWNLLPRDLQVVRIPLNVGAHKVVLKTIGGPELPAQEVHVQPRKIHFLNYRYTPGL